MLEGKRRAGALWTTYHVDGPEDLDAACFAAAFSLMICIGARPKEIVNLEPANLVRDQVDSIRLGERVRMEGNRSCRCRAREGP